MLEHFVYENHLGARFDGIASGVYLNYNDLRDWEWSYDTTNSRISRIYRSTRKCTLPLVICCGSDDAGIAVRNQLYTITERDVLAKQPGKIYIGDWYLRGYALKSTKSQYLVSRRYCAVTLEITSDDPAWHREQSYCFQVSTEAEQLEGFGYPYTYPHSYTSTMRSGEKIVNGGMGACPFRLRIFGPAVNPVVYVGGHGYTVEASIVAGEHLVIDGLEKTVVLRRATGYEVNYFDRRGRTDYIFQPIPEGQSEVTWAGDFAFDLTLIEERGEPEWT